MTEAFPPGPQDRRLGLDLYRRFLDAPAAFAAELARTYDGLAYVRLGWTDVYFVTRPDLVRDVLTARMADFPKLGRQMRALARVEGVSVITADGDVWRRRRAVVQAALLSRFADAVVAATRRRVDRWTPGEPFEVTEEMNRLALEVTGAALFDADWTDRAGPVREAVSIFRESMQREITALSADSLSPADRDRRDRAVGVIDDLIRGLIRDHRASDGGSVLSALLGDGTGIPPLTEDEARDEAASLFIASHDTTAAALAWLWILLARHPGVERRILEEIDRGLGGRPAVLGDLPGLEYTEMAIKETLRLYPPSGYLYGREAAGDVELGGYPVRTGSWVLISPYAAHRDPLVFPEPERFDPERFASGRAGAIPPYAYLPFGAGPRTCAGKGFAMAELVLVAATVLQRFRLRPEQGTGEVEPVLEVVLRPKGRVLMRAEPRRSNSVATTP